MANQGRKNKRRSGIHLAQDNHQIRGPPKDPLSEKM